MLKGCIRSMNDLVCMTEEAGILPFFINPVRGWSVEEHIDPALWFTERDGPWEWKGMLASEKKCVYGKFIRNKAAFISPEWFADLVNWRRDGLSWEERADEGLAPYRDRLLMRYLEEHPYALSKHARRECGFSKGYDTVVTRLQMQTYVILSDFRYDLSAKGVPYGWGNAVLDLADRRLGEAMCTVPAGRTPAQSFERMLSHLMRCMPEADENVLRKELR